MNGDRLFFLAIILVVIYLPVVPIAVMIFGSVQSGLPGTWTPLTFGNYVRTFSHSALYSAVLYSLPRRR
jgi:ABC-type spermidine/putrescine transport system permease subunit II